MLPRSLRFDHLLTPNGWLSPGRIEVDCTGSIETVSQSSDNADESVRGFAVPGMPNVHSHAFQRVFAGCTEHLSAEPGADSFWTWREAMYGFAERLTPEDVEAISALAFVEMVEAGFTSVGEFHYLHHRPDGSRYADPAELARAVLKATETAGIAITLLPVLYTRGGFDAPIGTRQRRFAHADLDELLALADGLSDEATVGLALHSLRAVTAAEVGAATGRAPIHIHVAEQRREVEECVATRGARPIRWLLDNAAVDQNWCLVHATHADADERRALATSSAVAGLCPTTEANLGDGVFPLTSFLDEGGDIALGTDSHASISVAEELRTLEYGQRLVHEQRNVTASAAAPHTARRLFEAALAGGARALAQPTGRLEPGKRADVVVLDADHSRLLGHGCETALDAWAFSSNGTSPVRDVFVRGERLVAEGRHARRSEVLSAFRSALTRIRSG
ncbi:MAG: formimidoylglutamate deiminase [Planctomycetes bacterium]|jgi:formimidoylglutamate deiminase|nr:formimidoylglutamate deiminase [Planctomycetota bacterium]MDP6424632.1 formimidoylglutamate deiminase [Planctomycetota bacterium]